MVMKIEAVYTIPNELSTELKLVTSRQKFILHRYNSLRYYLYAFVVMKNLVWKIFPVLIIGTGLKQACVCGSFMEELTFRMMMNCITKYYKLLFELHASHT